MSKSILIIRLNSIALKIKSILETINEANRFQRNGQDLYFFLSILRIYDAHNFWNFEFISSFCLENSTPEMREKNSVAINVDAEKKQKLFICDPFHCTSCKLTN